MTKSKKSTKTPASKKPSAKSATPKAAVHVEPPEPTKLVATPVRDKTTGRWGWCLREGKIEHHESKDTFDTEADATADGEKWLAEYARTDADRRKMLGWKPASAASKTGKAPTTTAKTKPKTAKANKAEKKDKAMSCLDAAAKVLAETKVPMNTKEMIEAMSTMGYWKPKTGKTPAATLYAAILRETQTKGAKARFKKTDRGLFALTGKE